MCSYKSILCLYLVATAIQAKPVDISSTILHNLVKPVADITLDSVDSLVPAAGKLVHTGIGLFGSLLGKKIDKPSELIDELGPLLRTILDKDEPVGLVGNDQDEEEDEGFDIAEILRKVNPLLKGVGPVLGGSSIPDNTEDTDDAVLIPKLIDLVKNPAVISVLKQQLALSDDAFEALRRRMVGE